MKKGYTEIIAIIDKSGSMESIKKDSIGGFNSFVNTQKELEGQANLTLVLFNNQVEIKYESRDIKDVKRLTSKTYNTCGTTAMNDAIGMSMKRLGQRLSDMEEKDRPENVIVVILTDGEENSSREFSAAAVKEAIREQREKYSWEFIFLGANQDAIEAGRNIGISTDRCMSYSADSKGMGDAYASIALSTTMIRGGNRDFNINDSSK